MFFINRKGIYITLTPIYNLEELRFNTLLLLTSDLVKVKSCFPCCVLFLQIFGNSMCNIEISKVPVLIEI